MEDKPQLDSKPAGYKVDSILLLESSFSRDSSVQIETNQEISNQIEIQTEAHEKNSEGKFGVVLTLHYTGLQNQKQVCVAKVKMIGIFQKYGDPVWPEDKFKAINGPAIIYPFIREYLFTTCLKAGIANVLLPTVNFKP